MPEMVGEDGVRGEGDTREIVRGGVQGPVTPVRAKVAVGTASGPMTGQDQIGAEDTWRGEAAVVTRKGEGRTEEGRH